MKLRITCAEAARRLSMAQDLELGAVERTQLKLHLIACHACRNVEQQLGVLRQAMRRLGEVGPADDADAAAPPAPSAPKG